MRAGRRKGYSVKRVVGGRSPELCGQVKGTAWERAGELRVDVYPWYERGEKQATRVRLLYDDAALYVQFRCVDRHISSDVTQLNGPVCRDSCVEFFASIDPACAPDYFNLEINCCGQLHFGWGPARGARRLVTAGLARRLVVAASESGPTRPESSRDRGWWVAAAVPFALLRTFTGKAVKPRSGTEWRANFYRCGGKTDAQYACWSPIEAPRPDFHRPEFFGPLSFE